MIRIALVAVVAMMGCGTNEADDPRLATLEVMHDGQSVGALAPTFDRNTHSYRLDVGLPLDDVQLVATPVEPTTTLALDASPLATGTPSSVLPLPLGPTTLAVVGTSPDGSTARYEVTITRADDLVPDAYLLASNSEMLDYFGHAVAISGDTLAVAAQHEDSAASGIAGDQTDNTAESAGAVYVFTRIGSAWSQQAYIKASNADPMDLFGQAIALAGDTLVVGAPHESSSALGLDGEQNDNSAMGSGAVYIYARTGSAWAQEAYVKASRPSGRFGTSVAIDGDTVAIGAPAENAAYVFTRTGSSWSEEARLESPEHDGLGMTIALSGDTLAVGTDDTGAAEAGAVYVFARAGTTWSQQAHLVASNADAGDRFGVGLALSADTLAVGASEEASATTGVNGDQTSNDAPGSGAVYVFARNGSMWSQQAYVKASNTDAGDGFGLAVALDGDLLAVGAVGEASAATGIDGDQADNAAMSRGAVYLFLRAGTTWSQHSYIKPANGGAFAYFGRALSFSAGRLVVGAPREHDDAWTGAAHVFE